MAAKLWRVSKEIESLVLAETEEEAMEIADDFGCDILQDDNRDVAWETWTPGPEFIKKWDGCIPWGSKDDKTVNEILEEAKP